MRNPGHGHALKEGACVMKLVVPESLVKHVTFHSYISYPFDQELVLLTFGSTYSHVLLHVHACIATVHNNI